MLCKFCREPSFLGEWNTPKETQNLPEKVCEACGEKVDTDTLVQQREEKRGTHLCQVCLEYFTVHMYALKAFKVVR